MQVGMEVGAVNVMTSGMQRMKQLFLSQLARHRRSAVLPAILLATAAAAMAQPAGDGRGAEPPYLHKDRNVVIFDESQAAKLNPLRRAAEQLFDKETSQKLLPEVEPPGLVSYASLLQGPSEEAILEEARVQALQSAAARIYFENYYLLGRDLLQNYLRKYGQRFIVRTEIADRRFIANEQIEMRVKLGVDLNAFYRDLAEKRFIAEPNLRPQVSVHLDERIDGEPDTSAGGHARIEKTMQDFLFRTRSRQMRQPPLNIDLSPSEDLLRQARMEAQRHNVDVLITGSLRIRPVGGEQILFDDYQFQEADLTLKMYRVDTGELIAQVADQYSAAGESVEDARAKLLDALVTRSSRKLAETLRGVWGYTMLDQADYRLMFNGLEAGLRPSLLNGLRRFSPDLQVYEKAYYGGVWVVNVVAPNDLPGELESFLRESTEPAFQVDKIDDRHFRLEVL
jgi:hypothetical protein